MKLPLFLIPFRFKSRYGQPSIFQLKVKKEMNKWRSKYRSSKEEYEWYKLLSKNRMHPPITEKRMNYLAGVMHDCKYGMATSLGHLKGRDPWIVAKYRKIFEKNQDKHGLLLCDEVIRNKCNQNIWLSFFNYTNTYSNKTTNVSTSIDQKSSKQDEITPPPFQYQINQHGFIEKGLNPQPEAEIPFQAFPS